MTTPSIRFVMEQARVGEHTAKEFLQSPEFTGGMPSPTAVVWAIKRDTYVRYRFGYAKPHLYLAQYPSGESYWRVCGSWNEGLNREALLACNELNRRKKSHA